MCVSSTEGLNLTEKTILAILKAKPDTSREELAEKSVYSDQSEPLHGVLGNGCMSNYEQRCVISRT